MIAVGENIEVVRLDGVPHGEHAWILRIIFRAKQSILIVKFEAAVHVIGIHLYGKIAYKYLFRIASIDHKEIKEKDGDRNERGEANYKGSYHIVYGFLFWI